MYLFMSSYLFFNDYMIIYLFMYFLHNFMYVRYIYDLSKALPLRALKRSASGAKRCNRSHSNFAALLLAIWASSPAPGGCWLP